MIKLWLKHKIFEKCIDTAFIQLFSNFQTKPRFHVGQRFDEMIFLVERYNKPHVNILVGCTITHIDDDNGIEVEYNYRTLYVFNKDKSVDNRNHWGKGKATFFIMSLNKTKPPIDFCPSTPENFF